MRRVGLVLLFLGLAGFLFASAHKRRYPEATGTGTETASSSEVDRARYGWETARWLLAGMGVMGLVFTVLPGKTA